MASKLIIINSYHYRDEIALTQHKQLPWQQSNKIKKGETPPTYSPLLTRDTPSTPTGTQQCCITLVTRRAKVGIILSLALAKTEADSTEQPHLPDNMLDACLQQHTQLSIHEVRMTQANNLLISWGHCANVGYTCTSVETTRVGVPHIHHICTWCRCMVCVETSLFLARSG